MPSVKLAFHCGNICQLIKAWLYKHTLNTLLLDISLVLHNCRLKLSQLAKVYTSLVFVVI